MNFAEEFPFLKNIDRCSKLWFIGPEIWFIFECLRMDKDWVYDKPEQWIANELFKKGQKFVANIMVVNDAAERTVKLYSDHVPIFTENEEQRASLMQAGEKHQKQVGDFKKSTLALNL